MKHNPQGPDLFFIYVIWKELKLDDILMMCKEYEKQIEEEQRVALSLRYSPFHKTLPKSSLQTH